MSNNINLYVFEADFTDDIYVVAGYDYICVKPCLCKFVSDSHRDASPADEFWDFLTKRFTIKKIELTKEPRYIREGDCWIYRSRNHALCTRETFLDCIIREELFSNTIVENLIYKKEIEWKKPLKTYEFVRQEEEKKGERE